ncbi:carboxypeptidase regulatory-like domain-containing protein [bacterium]|nr:carboxypeptidase regulatory-like domain-containing protein [bacterium]
MKKFMDRINLRSGDGRGHIGISGRNVIMKNFIKGMALMLFVCSAAMAGNITGTINYSGANSGDLYVMVGHGTPDTGGTGNLPVFSTQIVSGYSFPYNYDTGNISTGTDYNVFAWIDSTADGSYDSASEAGGMYSPAPVTVSVAAPTSNIDFTLQDPGAAPSGVTIDVDADGYDFSAATTAVWGSGADIMFSSGTVTAGVLELEVYNLDIYDAGTGWSDVNSVNTFDNTGSGSNHIEPLVDHYYTFKDDVNKETVIKVNAVSATSITFEYKYDYMSAGTSGYTYYDTGAGIPVSFESIVVTSDGCDNIISPNSDNNDDEFRVNYVLTSPSATIMSGGGAQVRIVADTNNNGYADTFKWEQVMWENDAPHFIPATAISTSSTYYNVNGNDWWGYFNSLSQDTKDALKLSYQELDAIQANSDYDFWEWIGQSEFTEQGGVYKTNPRTVSINFSWDWLKRIPLNGDCKIFIEAAAPWFSPQTLLLGESTSTIVSVTGVGVIRGTVTLPGGAPAAFAEVNAGNQYSWNRTYTDENGVYKMRGLGVGTYRMEARKAGFTMARKDNVVLSGDEAWQNFELGDGVKITATIQLPAPFQPYTDQWGNTVTELWGNLDAWSMNSPDGGWANFRISSGASSAKCVLPLVEGTYNIRANANKYVSISTTVVLKPAALGGVLGAGATFYTMTIGLNPAVDIKGYIVITSTNINELQQRYVDINARSTDNIVWAWGQREWDQNQWNIYASSTVIPFTVWNVTPNKGYELQFNSQYYAQTSTTVTVGNTSLVMTKANAIEINEGEVISGNVVINWSPTTYAIYKNQAWPDAGVSKIWLNIDAFDEQAQQGRNIGFSVPISSDSSTPVIAPYVIAGLTAGRQYQMNIWGLNQGFEQSDRWMKVSAGSTKTITFNPFSGKITGTIRNQEATSISSMTISISCQKLWMGDRNTPGAVIHPDAAGNFSIEELSTGEHTITIMELGANGLPLGNYGMVQKRAVVENGQTAALGNIYLKQAGQISGTLVLNSAKYSTWDDVYRVSTQPYTVYDNRMNPTQIAGIPPVIMALSVKQMKRGGDPMSSSLKKFILPSWNYEAGSATATFTIKGLAEGSYVIVPPLFFDKSNDGQAGMFGGQFSPNGDLASNIPMMPLATGETKELPPLTLIDGVKVKGTVQRSQTGVEGHYWIEIVSRENYTPVSPGKPIDFFDATQWGDASQKNTLNSPTQSFSFSSIYPGKYNAMIRVWDQSYKDAIVPFEIPAGSTKTIDLGTIMLKKGANITGTLRDKDTSGVVYDGVRVRCESIPRKEGTRRETRDYKDQWADPEIRISSTTGIFKLKNLPAGTYEVSVQCSKSDLSYAYVQKRIVGVVVPESTGDVDLGTIELKKGKNISGVVMTPNDSGILVPVPNVKVEAAPMFGMTHDWSDYRTDSQGKFVLKGLDPDVVYWKVTAAPRPEVWNRWEDAEYYAPSVRKNVIIGSTKTVITVGLPVKGITGVVMTPIISSKDKMEILMPEGFGDDKAGLKTFGAFIIVQNIGERYADPFDGYQTISRAPFWEGPDGGPGRWKSSFTIMGLSVGSYNMRVVAQNFSSEFITGIKITSSTAKLEQPPIYLSTGAVLSGIFTKADGSKVKDTEVEQVVAANPDMTDLVFGRLITNSGTGEIESYSIAGLRKNISYTVVLPMGDGGHSLFMAPEPQKITQVAQTYNFIFQDNAPSFISWIKKSTANVVTIEAFGSEPLRESAATDIVVLDGVYDINGSTVAGSFDSIAISLNKTDIMAKFTFSGSQNSIKYHFEGTDLNGNKQSPVEWAKTHTSGYPFAYTYYKAWDNYAQKNINPTFGGTLEVGNGDDSQVYVPTGSMDTDTDIKVTVGKTEFPSESMPAPAALGLSASSIRSYAAKRDSFYTSLYGAAMPSLEGPELAVSTMSALYEIKARLVSGPLASIAANQSVDLTFEYDSTISTHPATDNIYVYSSTASSNAEWNLVDGSPVINTDDNTITVQTNHFSYFAVFKLSAAPSVTIVNPTVSSVSPANGAKGTTISSMTITGTGFKSGSSVSFAPVGVSVSSVTYNSSTKLTAWNVVIAAGAVSGARSVTVTNADGGFGSRANAFYVSSASTTYNISAVTGGGAINTGAGPIILTITGSGLNVFANETADVIKLVNSAESYQIIGTTTSVSTGTLTVQFVILSSAAIGTYDLHLIDNSGEYLSQSAVVTVSANPYTSAFKSYVFPNPCRTNSLSIKVCVPGEAADVSAGTTVNGGVTIYTLTGEKVWSASQSLKKAYGPGDSDPSWGGENIINWDLKNSNGGNVASGVYFYIVEVAGQGRDKGKLAVIR